MSILAASPCCAEDASSLGRGHTTCCAEDASLLGRGHTTEPTAYGVRMTSPPLASLPCRAVFYRIHVGELHQYGAMDASIRIPVVLFSTVSA